MKPNNNIEELFRSKLENFEGEVNPSIWTNIQSKLNTNAAATSSAAGGSNIGLIAAVAVSSAIIGAVAVYSYLNNEKTKPTPKAPKEITIKNSNKTNVKTAKSKIKDNNIKDNTSETVKVEVVENTIVVKENGEEKTYKITTEDPVITESTVLASAADAWVTPGTSYEDNPEETNKEGTDATVNTTEDNNKEIKVKELSETTKPVASIDASAIGGYAPLTINFNSINKSDNAKWTINGGSPKEGSFIEHTFSQPGTYSVELVVTNKQGLSAKDNITIEVYSSSEISEIPNVFSPNNDGINDGFIIISKNIKQVDIQLYDKQTGKLVFKTNNLNEAWDGNLPTGEPAKAGTYFYIINAIGNDGNHIVKKGATQLRR